MRDSFKIDFVGIGASKCGTTWLGHMLEGHPELCMSEPKEVHFFNESLTFRSSIKVHFQNGIKWYQRFFSHCSPGKLKGEITPRYSLDLAAPHRIKQHNPEIKIIYCLRHPVERIWSHFQFASYFVGKEDRPILQALKEEPEYLNMTKYYENLMRYRALFPDEQIFIIWFDEIHNRPAQLLSDVFTFLGVDPAFEPEHILQKSNSARVTRLVPLQKYIKNLNFKLSGMGFSGLIKRAKRAGLNKFMTRLNSKPLEKKTIPEEAKNYIIEHLKEDVHQLELLLKKDLSHWLK